MNKTAKNNQQAAALLLSLWALFLLSAVVISWALDIDSRLTLNGQANRVLEAEAMAASGSEIATHPAIKPGSPLLHGGGSGTQKFEARITGEGGRINLNWCVGIPGGPGQELLRKYLEAKGVELNDRDRMIDCLADWVDADNDPHLNGAEAEGDYKPANRPLARIDEVKRVKGWEEFTSRPGWDEELTVSPTLGGVDPLWASRDVLLSLPTMTEEKVDAFLQLRRGADGIDGTADDPEFKTPQDLAIAFGLDDAQFKAIMPLLNLKETVVRVVSVGRSGNVSRTIEMVIRKTPNGTKPQLISWKER